MQTSKFALTLACAAMLASCGGGGGNNTGNSPTPTAGGGTPTPTNTTCSLSTRQDWVLNQLDEWYLFPDLLNTSANKASYTTLQDYIDAVVAPARAQSRDRYFTYITSIEEEEAYYEQGASAGFGFRLGYDTTARRVFVIETFENTPALGANIDRGSELLAIGTSEANLQTVNSLMAAGGPNAVIDALGPSDPGTSRVLRIIDAAGIERTVTISKTEYEIDPVSDRYGYKIIDDGGKQVGYLNLRNFIEPAVPDLVEAYGAFRAAGVTELVIDLRYNGGGLISVAAAMGDLMGRDLDGDVFSTIAFRDSKSSQNETFFFDPTGQSIAPSKIAFITTGGTASASEMVINGMQPYVPDTGFAIVGTNTYGKPVGQIAVDRAECDDRFRILALKVENANGNGEYYTGLASTVPNTCRADDDISYQLGDPEEGMVAAALDFLAGRSCTPFTGGISTQSVTGREPLMPSNPDSTREREAPGTY